MLSPYCGCAVFTISAQYTVIIVFKLLSNTRIGVRCSRITDFPLHHICSNTFIVNVIIIIYNYTMSQDYVTFRFVSLCKIQIIVCNM